MMKILEVHLRKQDPDRLKTLLDEYDRSKKFSACESFDGVMEQVKMRSNLFNLRLINLATKCFPCKEVCEEVYEYCSKKNQYCKKTSIRNFENTSCRLPSKGQVCICGGSSILVKFNISAAMECGKTVEDIVECAKELFGDFYSHLSEMNRVHYESEFVTWNLPLNVASNAVRRARANLNILGGHGVDKVIILEDVDLFPFDEMVYNNIL